MGSRTVRRVLAAVEAEPERAWRLADLAGIAGVSVRSLQEAFQRELGSTPLEQLRLVRLTRARRDLQAADPGTTSVTDVATRWGFFHLGRFSQVYRDDLPRAALPDPGRLNRRGAARSAAGGWSTEARRSDAGSHRRSGPGG